MAIAQTLDPRAKDAFAESLMESTAGAFRLFSIHLGSQLGYYEALAKAPEMTPAQLARATRTNVRYAREWMEQQAVAGILDADAHAAAPDERRFRLPPERAAVLTGGTLDDMSPLVQLFVGATRPIDETVEAYRTGGGVPYADYGRHLREGQAAMNRAMFLELLPREWLAAMPDVVERLGLAQRPARVADVGCGAGWSTIGLARAFPHARVDGIDLDPASVELARENAKAAGVEERARFFVQDAADPKLAGAYDLVTAFEALHDMARPVEALRAMRQLAAPGASVLVVDERVGETFTPKGEGLEWMMYGWSVLHCLPVGMAESPSAGTGTVMRPSTMRGYAEAAGFRRCEVLPVESPFFRFYRLTP